MAEGAAPFRVVDAQAAARTAGLDRIDTQVLLGHLLGCDRAWLIAHDDAPLSVPQRQQWQDWITRRQTGMPVAYLTGEREFHGLRLHVSADVLDPRPDTETLVDWALALMPAEAPAGRAGQALDLGTGSGAIALALKHRAPAWEITAVDRSAAALAVARGNGERLGLAVDWRLGTWFAALADDARSDGAPREHAARFDLIVSNPPYIAEADPHLPALCHEPREALVAGADGLDDVRQIVADAPGHLHPDGWLLLEHGHDQADAVAALLHASGWQEVAHRLDLAGHQRCTGARWPGDLPCHP